MTPLRVALVLGAVGLLATSSQVFAQGNPCNPCSEKGTMFHVNDPGGRNTVTFKSQAPLEDIVGTTNKITGYISFDPEHPDKGGHAQLTVEAGSFNTGIPLRNEHLLGAGWLDAEAQPEITLRVNEVTNVKKVKSDEYSATYDLQANGSLTLKGRTQEVSFPARVTYLRETERTKTKMAGNLLAARASFEVTLADYGIYGPKGMDLVGSKVGETITVEVSLMGSTASPEMAAGNPCGGKAENPCNPCNPCGK